MKRVVLASGSPRRRELLGCTGAELAALCPILEQVAARGSSCIVAGEQQLEACRDYIQEVTEIPC